MANSGSKYITELIQGIKNHDSEKTAEFVGMMYPIAQKRAAFILGKKGSAYVDDMVQESVLKAVKNIDRLQKPKAFKSWLNTITDNTIKDFVKTASYKNTIAISDIETTYSFTPYDPTDERLEERPDLALDEKTRHDIILKVMDALPFEQRTVIKLKFYDDMTIDEIARKLDLPVSTVTGRLQKGKAKIKAAVSEMQKQIEQES